MVIHYSRDKNRTRKNYSGIALTGRETKLLSSGTQNKYDYEPFAVFIRVYI